MEAYHVGTPEAVDIAYDIAGIGTRCVAAILDAMILGILLVLIAFGALGLAQLPDPAPTVAVILAITLVVVLLLFSGYYILFETIWHGQTPGKRALHIRVIKLSGYPIGFVEAAIRNLMRIIDILPGLYGIAVLTMFLDPRSRRLGDFAAGTVVVRESGRVGSREIVGMAASGPSPRVVAPLGAVDPEELQWNLRALTHDDLRVARSYLDRAPTFQPLTRQRVGMEVASMVADKIGARGPLDPGPFLRRVVDLSEGGG